MLVTLSSVSGAPGVSSWGLALAVGWPSDRPRVLLEADLSGGVLAARFGLSIDPGVTSMISEVRREPDGPIDLAGHGRRLSRSAWCVPGPVATNAAVPVWQAGAALLAPKLAADRRLWLADCGRVQPDVIVRPLLDAAMAHLVFSDHSESALMAVPAQVRWLSQSARVGLVVVGRRRGPRELSEFVGCDAVWSVRRCDVSTLAVEAAAARSRFSEPRRWPPVKQAVARIATWLTTPPIPSSAGSSADVAAAREVVGRVR